MDSFIVIPRKFEYYVFQKVLLKYYLVSCNIRWYVHFKWFKREHLGAANYFLKGALRFADRYAVYVKMNEIRR